MSELEIQDNDFTALQGPAGDRATQLSLEDCDLTQHAPPRELGKVTLLELADCTLDVASLERWLAACPNLQELDVEGAALGELTWSCIPARLKRLYVRGGKLEGLRSPPQTCGLEVLELTACGLQRIELPGSLASLQRVSLAFNHELRSCPDLPWSAAPFSLDLRGCGIAAWPAVRGSDKVGKADLSDNQLGSVPDSIGSWISLECLRLQDCGITAIDEAIASCKHLRELWLADNPLRKLPEGIARLPNLRVLELKRCQLDRWPESLSKLPTLEALLLAENELGEIPESLTTMRNLRNLMLWKSGVRKLPTSLQPLQKLEQLDLSYNPLTALPALDDLPDLGFLGLCGLRDLDWPTAFDTLAKLAHVGNISFTNSTFAHFDRRILDIPGLNRLDVNKTRIAASVWQECRKQAPHVTIWGA